jgi:glycosyltransferase involved in cell wall biosynthesis
MRSDPARARPIILYLVTEDWYFLQHRLPMARAAAAAGYEVHVATRVNKDRRAIEDGGFEVHPLQWRRGSLDPLDILSIVGEIRALYRALKPDIIHHIALQPIVIGSLASRGMRLAQLDSFFGLGWAFASSQLKAVMVRAALKLLLPRLTNRPHTMVTVENSDDKAVLAGSGLRANRIFVLPGSGVDIDRLVPLAEPNAPVTAAFVGRLVVNKGVRTLIAAHELLSNRGMQVPLLIAGAPDPANPASIPMEEINTWKRRAGITVMGHVSDIRGVWKSAHFAILPSRGGEGLPMSLLEAAACGRPLLATDVPGCREIARPGVNALLVPLDDPSALAEAISRMARDSELRRRFGQASRRIVEAEYSSEIVGREVVRLYDRLAGRQPDILPENRP